MAIRVRPADLPPSTGKRAANAAGECEIFWEISPSTYRLVWLSLLLLYVSVEIYLLAVAGGYVVLLYVPSFSYYADTFHLIPVDDIPLVVGLYGIVLAVYCAHIARFVYYVLRYRVLLFPWAAKSVLRAALSHPTTLSAEDLRRQLERKPTVLQLLVKRVTKRVIKPLRHHVFSTSGLCGVRGVFFEPVVLLRELIEIAIQTYQAYQCSKRTTKFWINATFALLIVVNCCSSPLLHRFSKSSVSAARVTVLYVDLTLDLVWFAVIPTLLWFPYFHELFTDELVLYQDTYVIEGVMELPALFVTSSLDALVKLLPPISIYFTMQKIELLTRQTRQHRPDASLVMNSRRALPAIVPSASNLSSSKRFKCEVSREQVEKWLRMLLLCWGVVVLVVFVYANFVYSPACSAGCQLVLRPWFQISESCRCAALEINCLELEIEGTATQIHDALLTTNTEGLLNLIIAHCPALEVPPSIHSLNDLYGIAVLNCTIVSWDDDAAITSADYPHLGHVLLIHTLVSDIPRALLSGDLPTSLCEIGIIASNLSRLPDDLHEKWLHVTTLLFDYGDFSEYPMVLSKMPALETISFFKNQISHVPDDALRANRELRFFVMSENPLSSLPSSLGSLQTLAIVDAMWTNILDAHSPLVHGDAYMLSQLRIFGFESPMCGKGSSASSAVDDAPWLRCDDKFFTYKGTRSYGYYPLEAKLDEKKFARMD